jgi:Fe-S-cluster containining protein
MKIFGARVGVAAWSRVRDGPGRRLLKAVARGVGRVELSLRRWWLKRRGEPRYRLTGSCNGCGRCCEAPSMQVDRLTWHVRSVQAVFLWWQRVVNGFLLQDTDARFRLFIFRCTHYDAATRRCDSYDSRPLMCRDYPVNLTFDALPSLFDECSHGVVDRKADALRKALVDAGLQGESLEAIERKLYLKDTSRPASPPE